MWKLCIADDEKTIRRGLRHAMDWEKLGIKVIGEAEDGEVAYEKAKALRPDILFVDICMPFLNGLELIKALEDVLPDAIIIIITGHDEFDYAREAVRLNVFDYLLKPVEEEELEELMLRAIADLEQKKQRSLHQSWSEEEIKKNFLSIRDGFLNKLLVDGMSREEVDTQLEHLGIYMGDPIGITAIKPINRVGIKEKTYHFDKELLYFAMKNIIEEMTKDREGAIVFEDAKGHILVIVPITSKTLWYELNVTIEKAIERYLQRSIFLSQDVMTDGIYHLAHTYKKLVAHIEDERSYTPVVIMAKKYIDQHYYMNSLTLDQVAAVVQANPTYLSRLLKNEIGKSFVDYLTKVRIEKSIEFMSDPTMKMYEIAEQVGYNTQHYFSSAFKRVMGMSPNAYKRGGRAYTP